MSTTPSTGPAAFEQWARLELMGHRVRYGHLSEAEVFGGKMARIEVHAGEKVVATEFYGLASIYAVTVMTREMVVEATDPERRTQRMLMSAPEPLIDDDEEVLF